MSALVFIALFAAANVLAVGAHAAARRARRAESAASAREASRERQRGLGVRALVLIRRHQYSRDEGPLTVRRNAHLRRRTALEQFAAKVGRQLWRGGEWSSVFTVVVVVLALAWLFVFVLLRNLDIRMLEALGYMGGQTGLAMVLGTLIALAFTVIGIMIAGLLDLHPLLPPGIKLGRVIRLTLILNLAAAAIGLAIWLPHVAVFRSEGTLGPEVVQLQEVLAQARQDGNPTEIRVAQVNLAQAQQRLKAGESVDRTLAVVVPLLELMIAWAPMYACELLLLGGTQLLATRHRRREQVYADKITQLDLDYTDQLTQDLIGLGFSADDVERELRRPHHDLAAGSPVGEPQADGEAADSSRQDGAGARSDMPLEDDASTDEPPQESGTNGTTPRWSPDAGAVGAETDPDVDDWNLA